MTLGGQIIHGFARRGQVHPLYRTWLSMRQRCSNPNSPAYQWYGRKGVSVAKRWNSFPLFLRDIGPRPSKRYTLERRNNNGNYNPSNCTWATWKTQANNKSNNRPLYYKGQIKNIGQWCEQLNLSVVLVLDRLDRLGWTVSKALSVPKRKMLEPLHEYQGEKLTLRQLSLRFGIRLLTLRNRISVSKWSVKKAVETAPRNTKLTKYGY